MNNLARDLSNKKKGASQRNDDANIDAKLVKRFKKGDKAAFGELVERYQRKVFSIALGMVKNQEEAMDITQDTFVKVHRYLKNFQGTSSFYTWLYRIVLHLAIDHMRKEGRRTYTEFDERIGTEQESNEKSRFLSNRSDLNPSTMVSRKELAEKIQDAVAELPPYHRAVIIMREVEGLSYTEMATILEVSKGTVMSRLHHARQKLRRLLAPYIEEEFTIRE